MDMNDYFKYKRRVVIKIGSSSLQHVSTGRTDLFKMEKLVRQLCDLRGSDMDVCLVSSGAIAVGVSALGLESHPTEIATKQACAAVGQARLMMIYQRLFSEYNQTAAQVLITKNTMLNDLSRENTCNTFNELFRLGIIPVVNENDTVSTYEMRFGDNDTISAIVASLISADLLILLSDIDGMYTDDPRKNPEAKLIEQVESIDDRILSMARESTGSDVGTGGMTTKLTAAHIVTHSGADMIIANGADVDILRQIFEGKFTGTFFRARKNSDFDLRAYIRDSIK